MPQNLKTRSIQRVQLAIALFVGVSSLALMHSAQAQDAQAAAAAPLPASQTVEEVVVTGSRIRGAAPVGSTVIGVTLEDASKAGAVTTAQILEQIPEVFNLGVSESSRGQNGGSGNITYGSSINLRGIGPYATLTLLDGHRVVPNGTTGQAVDPSVIPTIALKRVDIVADGASAIYGSDAVAGVANLIMRRNVEGIEGTVRYGSGSDYNEKLLSVIGGHKWDTGQFTLSFEHGDHSSLNGVNRSFYTGNLTAQGGGDYRVVQCNPGNIVVGGVSYAIPAGGVTPGTVSSLVAGTNKCDNLKSEDLIPKQTHNSAAFTVDQEITDGVDFYAQGFLARRDFVFNPAYATAALTVPSTNAFFTSPVGTHPASETVNYSYINDLPRNTSSGYSQTYNGTFGANVALPWDWRFDADVGYGRDDDESISTRGINNTALAAALASSNPATAFNPFGGVNSPAVLAAISNQYFIAPGSGTLKTAEAKLDGPLFDLPGGPVRFALGGEFQDYRLETGSTTGPAGATTTSLFTLSRQVKSAYTEVLFPLIGDNNSLPGIKSLDIDLAGRLDQYSDVGVTRNPKAGVNWSPIDGLMFHGNFGTSFRAPLLTQIHAASQGLYVQNYSDPTCGCITQGVTLSGGNLNLKPENATTYSAGVDYVPPFLSHAKFNLTFFDVDYVNQITSYLSDLTILNREATFAGTGIITRNPSAALIASLRSKYPVLGGTIPANVVLFVDGRTNNLGRSLSQGFDFSANYDLPTRDYGKFSFGLTGTYFTRYDVAVTPASSLAPQLNTIYNPLKLKLRGSIFWADGNWSNGLFVNYVNSYSNNLTSPTQSVDAYTTVDLHISYRIGELLSMDEADRLTVGLDVSNLFDTNPPFVNIAESPNGGGGFDATASNPIGRIVSMSLGFKF